MDVENFNQAVRAPPVVFAGTAGLLVLVVLPWYHLAVLGCGWVAATFTRLAGWLGYGGA